MPIIHNLRKIYLNRIEINKDYFDEFSLNCIYSIKKFLIQILHANNDSNPYDALIIIFSSEVLKMDYYILNFIIVLIVGGKKL